jgi:hypothetical protein
VILLDENINASQREQPRKWHIPVRQIGVDLRPQGIQDEAIIPFLHQLRRPTFFTRDADFFRRYLCHDRYCLVHLDIEKHQVAFYIRRLLRHSDFDTQAKRMAAVIQVASSGLLVWRLRESKSIRIDW